VGRLASALDVFKTQPRKADEMGRKCSVVRGRLPSSSQETVSFCEKLDRTMSMRRTARVIEAVMRPAFRKPRS